MSVYDVELITDSTCDIPQELINHYGIEVLSHFVIWGEEQYRDRVSISPQEFYERLKTDPRWPTTAAISTPDFVRAFLEAKARGAKQVLAILISSAMSRAFESAQQAAKQVDIPVHLVDAKGPTMSVGWQVLAAARVREAGGKLADMVAVADAVRKRLVQFVLMDSLEYLARGGRIGNAKRWIGTVLQIKPLVSINHENGLVEPAATPRTRQRAIETLYQMFFERLDVTRPLHIAVLHGNALESAQHLAERIQNEFHPLELLINITGPVLGINTGPGALALCGYNE